MIDNKGWGGGGGERGVTLHALFYSMYKIIL